MKKAILFLFSFVLSSVLFAQNIATGSWRIHLPYNDVLALAETPVYIYIAAEKGLYSFHKISGEVALFSKLDGFSDVEPILVRYQTQKDLVVIVYKNTNIDILKGQTVINIPDILRKTILGIKEIYDINLDGDFMNLSCSFGVVQIDLDKFEVKDSYLNIGPGGTQLSINSFERFNDTFFVASNQGIFYAPAFGVNHSDFNSWKLLRSASYSDKLRKYNNKMYAVVDSVLQY